MSQVIPHSLFTEFDINLFKAGKHYKLYEKFGAHPMELNGEEGVIFQFGHLRPKKSALLVILISGTEMSTH